MQDRDGYTPDDYYTYEEIDAAREEAWEEEQLDRIGQELDPIEDLRRQCKQEAQQAPPDTSLGTPSLFTPEQAMAHTAFTDQELNHLNFVIYLVKTGRMN